jgi:hypothetical protein
MIGIAMTYELIGGGTVPLRQHFAAARREYGATFALFVHAVPFRGGHDLSEIGARGEGMIEGLGVAVEEMQEVARRQLVGSIVAGILVVGVAGLVALQPSRQETGVGVKPAHMISLRRPALIAPSHDMAVANNVRERSETALVAPALATTR